VRSSDAGVSDHRPALFSQQKPVRQHRRSEHQHPDENPALPAIAFEDRCGPMEEGKDDEQAHHEAKPVDRLVDPR
jgi:hypothetical protein